MLDSLLSKLSDFGDDVVRRLLNFLICFDQLVFCVITLGNSAPDETISAYAYRAESQGKWQGKVFRPIIDTIMFFDPNHCQRAHEAEVFGWQDGA